MTERAGARRGGRVGEGGGWDFPFLLCKDASAEGARVVPSLGFCRVLAVEIARLFWSDGFMRRHGVGRSETLLLAPSWAVRIGLGSAWAGTVAQRGGFANLRLGDRIDAPACLVCSSLKRPPGGFTTEAQGGASVSDPAGGLRACGLGHVAAVAGPRSPDEPGQGFKVARWSRLRGVVASWRRDFEGLAPRAKRARFATVR